MTTDTQMIYYTVHRRIGLLFMCLGTTLSTIAQRIENIRPVARQDTIILTYDLVGAQPGEEFAIKAFCWNGFKDIELKTTDGPTIVGRGQHKLTWRVLNDVDILAGDSITFTIIATLPEGPGLSTADQKRVLFAELTAKTDLYLEQLYNQAVLFGDFQERPFESSSAYAKLDEQTKLFNGAYEALLTSRRRFEANVETLWGSTAGAATETFFNRLFESTHQNALKSYNDVLKTMNDVVHGHYKGKSKKSLVQDIQTKIYNLTKDADSERGRLKTEAKDLYKQLPL